MKKLSLWLPVCLIVLCMIFFSSRPAGSPVLEQFPVPPQLGHFIGYAMFGFLLYRALANGLSEWQNNTAVKTVFIVLGYAVLDEFFQGFIPARERSALDLAIDGAGAVSALLLLRLWFGLRSVVKAQPQIENGGFSGPEHPRRSWVAPVFFLSAGAAAVFILWGLRPFFIAIAAVMVLSSGLLFQHDQPRIPWALGLQGAASVFLLLAGAESFKSIDQFMHGYGFPTVFVFALVACWVVLVTNSFRLFEELDGLTVLLAVVICFTLILLFQAGIGYWHAGLLLLILAGCLGLYPYNFKPPVLHMGRAGVLILGFTTAALFLLSLGSAFSPGIVLNTVFLFIYPAADIVQGLFTRTVSKEHAGRWGRAVYLFFVVMISAGIYLVAQKEIISTAALAPFLLLAAVPGLIYTVAPRKRRIFIENCRSKE